MMGSRKRKRGQEHPYLSGNFAPIHQTLPLTPCTYTGTIPDELIGGQYVRNGGNPVTNEDLGRDAHWFDGDGMLAGVNFRRTSDKEGGVQPEFVNQYILTDVLLSTLATPTLKSPILPSIATLVNPASSLVSIVLRIFRTLFLVLLSHLPGSRQAIRKISVANTSVLYHDGRALATCESGPPMRIALPSLETIGWYNGKAAENEPKVEVEGEAFGGTGLLSFMKEWTTAHPKVDPETNEMILFHSTFTPPYVHYSIIPATHNIPRGAPWTTRLVNAAVPGVSSAKMMHDFGVSKAHTVIMDLPLSLDPLNLAKNKPVVAYDSSQPSRFGVFPRRDPSAVRWYETAACCIFHTANTWDSVDAAGTPTAVNMLVCRLTSASLVFGAGNIAAPQPTPATTAKVAKRMPFFSKYDLDPPDDPEAIARLLSENPLAATTTGTDLVPTADLAPPDPVEDIEPDQCRLYYYSFALPSSSSLEQPKITHQFALSSLPFEFPTTHPSFSMSPARYIYGCTTTTHSSFSAALGRAVQIDALVKVDAAALIARGKRDPPREVTGVVDGRSVGEILAQQGGGNGEGEGEEDAVRVFQMPRGWYAQEPRFVPRVRTRGSTEDGHAEMDREEDEDEGYLVLYAFDEARWLDERTGMVRSGAQSEFWVLDAKGMRDVVARVEIPQRVPYGLHGSWFSEGEVRGQRGWEGVRSMAALGVGGLGGRGVEGREIGGYVVGVRDWKEMQREGGKKREREREKGWWMAVRRWLESAVA